MKTLIRCRALWRLTWVCTVCLCPKNGTLGLYRLTDVIIKVCSFIKFAFSCYCACCLTLLSLWPYVQVDEGSSVLLTKGSFIWNIFGNQSQESGEVSQPTEEIIFQTEAGSRRKLQIMSFKFVLINVETPDKPVLSGQGARPSTEVLYKVPYR